ncbi:protein immune deficiency [Condylostylus longicornis]|uniref:protein immune deficiency n=1 Tax=Condylostylus longicornis TaxID=2530218 RepID=UPI00244E4191|nr:protein immune deficiency [Condylostylus longicornis]
MVKELKKLFKNLINKSRTDSNLEIDAVAINSTTSDNLRTQQNLQVVEREQIDENRNDSQHENTIDTFQNNVVPSSNNNTVVDLHPTSSSNMWNTAVNELNSVQNVYNFSNIDGLHIGNSIVFNGSNTNDNGRSNRNRNINSTTNVQNVNQSQSNRNKIKITESINKLFRSVEDVEESVLSELSEFIGKNYQRLMRDLGLSQTQIETVELDYNVLGHKEIIFQLLLKWSEEFFETANYGKLSRKLWKCGCRESVVKLEEILSRHKTNRESKEDEEQFKVETEEQDQKPNQEFRESERL